MNRELLKNEETYSPIIDNDILLNLSKSTYYSHFEHNEDDVYNYSLK